MRANESSRDTERFVLWEFKGKALGTLAAHCEIDVNAEVNVASNYLTALLRPGVRCDWSADNREPFCRFSHGFYTYKRVEGVAPCLQQQLNPSVAEKKCILKCHHLAALRLT